jgi:WS/DGAT/MGAT family acyltransferase
MTRHRMSAPDAAWLHMERPANRMIVTSVMWFDEPLDWDAVRTVIEQRLVAPYPRFTQRVAERPAMAWWEDVEDFDLDAHLHRARLPDPGHRADLETFVSGLLHRPLAVHRPLWEAYFVDGYHGRASALVLRIHHCIADGIALARVMMSLTDDPGEAASAGVAPAAREPSPLGVLPALAHLGACAARHAVHPGRLAGDVRDWASATKSFARLVGLPPDHHTALHQRVDIPKRVLWADPRSLTAVHEAAHRHGVTINDLVLCAVSAALRGYLAEHDGTVPDVRAILPVNLRPLDEPLPRELGNRFGLAYLSLPTSRDDPAERLAEVHRRAETMKRSAEGIVSFDILGAVGRTPYSLEQTFVMLFAAKGTLVVTNVAGPTRPVFLAGRRVRGTVSWPPESGNVGVGISVISYDGELTIGVMIDEHLVDDGASLLATLVRDLDELVAAAPPGPQVAGVRDLRPSPHRTSAGGLDG